MPGRRALGCKRASVGLAFTVPTLAWGPLWTSIGVLHLRCERPPSQQAWAMCGTLMGSMGVLHSSEGTRHRNEPHALASSITTLSLRLVARVI